jgi:NAD(P)-dependent dehydrogenase (short-subunit alcohol dehydrogenase family)
MGRLTGKNILITGGNSGIGLATAQEFDREGARVAICGLNERTLQAAKETLGARSLAVRADVSKLADLDTMFATIKREFGHLDGVFVNAGLQRVPAVRSGDRAKLRHGDRFQFQRGYFTIQKALPLLRPGSSVVINASVGARKGWPTTSTVSTCKAAVVHLARILSAELVDRGIRVNTLSPDRRTRRCSVASQAKSRARRSRASLQPTIPASGWPIRRKSRSWRFISRRTIPRTSSEQTS